MALNSSIRARVEIPTRDQLPSANVEGQKLPKVFGNNWNDVAFNSTHAKSQALHGELAGTISKGFVKTNVRPPMAYPSDAHPNAIALSQQTELELTMASATGSNAAANEAKFTLEDKALRFFAFWVEAVPESAAETQRVRNVSLTYFLADETIMVQEDRVANNGLQGGLVVSRQRVPSPSGEGQVTINDIAVGASVVIFSREYHCYACDEYSREFLEAIGVTVAPNAGKPDDQFITEYRAKRINGKVAGLTFETKDLRVTLESLSSQGRCAQRFPEDTLRAQRFVSDSGKVLRFYGHWVDEEADAATVRTFDVRYFIEDDTITVTEQANPGSRNQAIQKGFLSRRRLPKNNATSKAAELTFAGRVNGQREVFLGGNEAYYGADDLAIGATVAVFGRNIVLHDCDGYTRQYYAQHFGKAVGPAIDVAGKLFPTQQRKNIVVPPPTGFGTPEDSMASCGSLILKQPRKDISGWKKFAGQTLRFQLKLHNPERTEDQLRNFTLTFYLDDGEIMVTEVPVRNTGFTGGKFLKKQRLAKKAGETPDCYFTLADITVGAVLSMTGFRFEVVRADEHTENFLQFTETNGRRPSAMQEVAADRMKELLSRFFEFVSCRYVTLTEAFRAFDRDHDGFIALHEMKEVLESNQLSHREEESVALIATFDRSQHGKISYADFMESLSGDDSGARIPAGSLNATTATTSASAAITQNRTQHGKLMTQLYHRLEARCLNVFEMFRLFSTMPRAYRGRRGTIEVAALTNATKDAAVTPLQLRRGLSEVLGMKLSAPDMAYLLAFFFPSLPTSEYEAEADGPAGRHAVTLKEFQHKITEIQRLTTL